MRAVALAQSGEDTLTPERVRETATDAVKMAIIKGGAKPPISSSKGKKESKESKWFSKTTSNRDDVLTEHKWFSKTAPGSSKGVVPTTPPTSGLTTKVEDKVAAVRSSKSEFQREVEASEKETT